MLPSTAASLMAAFVWAAALPAPGGQPGELVERTLAIVGTQVITLGDVRAALALDLVSAAAPGDRTAAATQQLIDRQLILREVQRYAPPAPSESEVETGMESARKKFPDAAAFKRALAETGFTEDRLRAWIRDDLRSQAYMSQRFASASTPERRRELVDDWIADLRRRTGVVILPQ